MVSSATVMPALFDLISSSIFETSSSWSAAGDSAERPCFSLLRELHEKLLGRTLDKHGFLQDEVKCLTRVEIR